MKYHLAQEQNFFFWARNVLCFPSKWSLKPINFFSSSSIHPPAHYRSVFLFYLNFSSNLSILISCNKVVVFRCFIELDQPFPASFTTILCISKLTILTVQLFLMSIFYVEWWKPPAALTIKLFKQNWSLIDTTISRFSSLSSPPPRPPSAKRPSSHYSSWSYSK